jgi:TM2 domain-containing membrane protein YozV
MFELFYLTFLLSPVILGGTGRALHYAWFANGRTDTQRCRYTVLIATNFIAAFPCMLLLLKANPVELMQLLGAFRITASFFGTGWIVTFLVYFHFTMPIWTGLIAIRVYCKPAYFGRNDGGGAYILTQDVRSKNPNPIHYDRNLRPVGGPEFWFPMESVFN